MKKASAIALVVLAVLLAGCGEDETATSAERQDPRFAVITGGKGKAKPKIKPSNLPPPKKVLSRDIEVGTGAVAKRGDWVWVYFVGVNYKTGKVQYERWRSLPPLLVDIGSGDDGIAWEKGIEGMRVGGRRELIIPSKLLYDTGTVDYVVDLVRVKPTEKKQRGG